MTMTARRVGSATSLLRGMARQRGAYAAGGRWPDGVRRVYLYHVRKTGGTSITAAVTSLGGEDSHEVEARIVGRRPRCTTTGSLVVAAHDRLALQTGWFHYGWSHVPAWRLRLPPGTLTVTVLRDPVDRVVSLYRYLADPDSDAGHVFGAPLHERRLAADGFDAFVERSPRRELLNQLAMFSRDLDPAEAARRIQRCSLVARTESLTEDARRLSARLGRPLVLRSERRSTTPFSLTAQQREALRALLRPEYRMLDLVGAHQCSSAGVVP